MDKNQGKKENLLINDNSLNNSAFFIGKSESRADSRISQMTYDSNAEVEKPKLLTRLFGPMRPGSLRGSIFTLSNLTLGVGCLSLPQVLFRIGFVEGILALLIVALISYWMLSCISEASQIKRCYDYSALVKIVFGGKISIVVNVIFMLYYLMVLVAYQVISNFSNLVFKILGTVLYELFYSSDFSSNDDFLAHSFWAVPKIKVAIHLVISIFVLIPVSLIRDFSKMGFVSLLSISSLLYIALVLICQFPFYHQDNRSQNPPREVNWADPSKGFKEDLIFFPSIATIFYAFGNATGCVPIYRSLRNKSEKRINKVYLRATILSFAILMVIAVFGILSIPQNPPDLIIFRPSIFENDWIMLIGKIAIILALITSFPPNYGLFRYAYFRMFKDSELEFSSRENYFITFMSLTSSAVISSVFTNVNTCMGIVGGFLAVIICFFLPGLIYVKLNQYSLTNWRNVLSLTISIGLLLLGWTGGIVLVIDQIRGLDQI